MSGWRQCDDTRRYLVACFVVKQDRLGFPSFASNLAEERRCVVHMASSRRLRGSEAKDGRFDGIRCCAMEVGPNYRLVVGGISLPLPWPYAFILLGVVYASCPREERREVRDLLGLSKSGMMFGWFTHLVDS
jgi:hypothetical protein